jgi:hypothetical protein
MSDFWHSDFNYASINKSNSPSSLDDHSKLRYTIKK